MTRCPSFNTIALSLLVLATGGAGGLRAGSARELVTQGNEAYGKGEFEQALSLYDEASVEIPESAEIHFNRGVVHYGQEDYVRASEALEAAALRSRDPALASRAKFNLGNCAFRQAQRQRDSDLKKAIGYCEKSIAYYQEARDFDPEYKEAAENIEIVRLFVKVLLDEQKQQQEQQEQQQQEEENIGEKLKKLLERQNQLAGKSEALSESRPDPATGGEDPKWKEAVAKLAEEQTTLRGDTGEVLEEMKQMSSQARQQAAAGGAQGQTPPAQQQAAAEEFANKLDAASGDVNNAITDEQKAAVELRADAPDVATVHQRYAASDLEEALKKLSDDQQQQQQQQQGGGDEQEENQDEQEQEGEDEQEQEQQEGEDQQQEQQSGEDESESQQSDAQMNLESADDILNEEKRNQDERRPVGPARGRPVDRDW